MLFRSDQIVSLAKPKLLVGVAPSEYPSLPCVPEAFVPEADLSDTSLPAHIAGSFKAMTSGGSTGLPKLIVSTTPGVWDPELPFVEIPLQGTMFVPGPLYHNGPFLFAMVALFKGCMVGITSRFDAEHTLERVHTLKASIKIGRAHV